MSRILLSKHLWKTVDNFRGGASAGTRRERPSPASLAVGYGTSSLALRACSACSGDYEDPDRTARNTSDEVGEPNEDPSGDDGEEGGVPGGRDDFAVSST